MNTRSMMRCMNTDIAYVRASELDGSHIGRVVLVSGLHIGTLCDYEVGKTVTLYLAGRAIVVERDAVCAFDA